MGELTLRLLLTCACRLGTSCRPATARLAVFWPGVTVRDTTCLMPAGPRRRPCPEEPDAHSKARDQRLQVFRGPHRDSLRLRRRGHRRAERLREVEHRRRHPLVDGRAERQAPPRPRDVRRHLQRLGAPRPPRDGRGDAGLRQLRPGGRHCSRSSTGTTPRSPSPAGSSATGRASI